MKQTENMMNDIITEFRYIFIKITAVFVILASLMCIFGIYRCEDNDMYPAIEGGDILLYYRSIGGYHISDIVLVENEGHKKLWRTAASDGDTVEIVDGRLYINGFTHDESRYFVYEDSDVEEDLSEKLKNDEYLLISDGYIGQEKKYRCIKVYKKEIKGNIITLIRRIA